MRPYKFSVELDAIREQIHQEHSLDIKYIPARYKPNIMPVQILFSEYFKDQPLSAKEKKEIRLKILSMWVENEVKSAYDLTVYQCSTIIDFLDSDQGLGKRARKFLEDCQAKVEGRNITGESQYRVITNAV